MRTILLVFVSLFVSLVIAEPSTLNLFFLNTTDTNAICNDGSPAAYYFKKGDPNKWIIYFEGGDWCFDEVTCLLRFAREPLFSSKTYTPTVQEGGIFDNSSTNNPDWYTATYVYLKYCSSDSFSGNHTERIAFFDFFHFKGKVIIHAAIQELLQRGLGSATQILVSGSSAGGASLLANIDYIKSLLPPVPSRIFLGHIDAGFFVDATPKAKDVTCFFLGSPITQEMGFSSFFQEGFAFWRGQPDKSCAEHYKEEAWKCYMAEYALPYIDTPVLTHQETEDVAQLFGNADFPCQGFVNDSYLPILRKNITVELSESSEGHHRVFAPACLTHSILRSDDFWTIDVGKVTDQMALHTFFTTNGTGYQNLIDDCMGINCSPNCPKLDPAEVVVLCAVLREFNCTETNNE